MKIFVVVFLIIFSSKYYSQNTLFPTGEKKVNRCKICEEFNPKIDSLDQFNVNNSFQVNKSSYRNYLTSNSNLRDSTISLYDEGGKGKNTYFYNNEGKLIKFLSFT